MALETVGNFISKGKYGRVYLAREASVTSTNFCIFKAFEIGDTHHRDKEFDNTRRIAKKIAAKGESPRLCKVDSLDAYVPEFKAVRPGLRMDLVSMADGVTAAKTIEEWVKAKKNFSSKDFLEQIILPLWRDLASFHHVGVAHQDLGPQNILIAEGGTSNSPTAHPVIIDWGKAWLTEDAFDVNIGVRPGVLSKAAKIADIRDLGACIYTVTNAKNFCDATADSISAIALQCANESEHDDVKDVVKMWEGLIVKPTTSGFVPPPAPEPRPKRPEPKAPTSGDNKQLKDHTGMIVVALVVVLGIVAFGYFTTRAPNQMPNVSINNINDGSPVNLGGETKESPSTNLGRTRPPPGPISGASQSPEQVSMGRSSGKKIGSITQNIVLLPKPVPTPAPCGGTPGCLPSVPRPPVPPPPPAPPPPDPHPGVEKIMDPQRPDGGCQPRDSDEQCLDILRTVKILNNWAPIIKRVRNFDCNTKVEVRDGYRELFEGKPTEYKDLLEHIDSLKDPEKCP